MVNVLGLDAMGLLIVWLMLAVAAGVISKSKGRSFWAYVFVSIFFTPLLGLLLAFGMAAKQK